MSESYTVDDLQASQNRRSSGAGPPTRIRESEALKTAVELLGEGFRPVPIYPRGFPREGMDPATGKEPRGKSWGLKPISPETLAVDIRQFVRAGFMPGWGVCLGPGRAPGGGWLADVEGDGPEAEESRARLLGGEVITTRASSSTRGIHQFLRCDEERLKAIASRMGAFQVKGPNQPGVYHLPDLPGLELRLGGYKTDGMIKQLQSVVPPTPGTDGKPRQWLNDGPVADAPESLYLTLEAMLAAAAPPAETTPQKPEGGWIKQGKVDRVDAYLKKALDAGCGRIVRAAEGTRHATVLSQVRTLAGYLHYGAGFTETELIAAATDAADKAAPGRKADNARAVTDAIADGKAAKLTLPQELDDIARGVATGSNGKHSPPPASSNGKVDPQANGHVGTHVESVPESDDIEIVDRWPTIDVRAFHGVAGDIVWMAAPHSEGDPVATLVQLLIAFSNAAGRNAYWVAGATRHYLNLFCVLVGLTALGRKGSSWDVVEHIIEQVDPRWCGTRVKSGLVSGEGLIHHVRDPTVVEEDLKEATGKNKGKIIGKQSVTVDPGVEDKRLLILEPEFGRVLKVASRDGNTLTDNLRLAWDKGRLGNLGKTSPASATNAHISVVAHATQADITKYLTETDASNGFANRFLWVASRRSKLLPDGGDLESIDWTSVKRRLDDAMTCAGSCSKMGRDPEARKIWHEVYEDLSAGKPDLLGAVLSRAEAQVMRLACVYALLDGSPIVRAQHLLAALALWDYCESSARLVFGNALGGSDAEKLLVALKEAPEGLTRTQITSTVFAKNKKATVVAAMLSDLLTKGLIHRRTEAAAKGRPAERWFAGGDKDGLTK